MPQYNAWLGFWEVVQETEEFFHNSWPLWENKKINNCVTGLAQKISPQESGSYGRPARPGLSSSGPGHSRILSKVQEDNARNQEWPPEVDPKSTQKSTCPSIGPKGGVEGIWAEVDLSFAIMVVTCGHRLPTTTDRWPPWSGRVQHGASRCFGCCFMPFPKHRKPRSTTPGVQGRLPKYPCYVRSFLLLEVVHLLLVAVHLALACDYTIIHRCCSSIMSTISNQAVHASFWLFWSGVRLLCLCVDPIHSLWHANIHARLCWCRTRGTSFT